MFNKIKHRAKQGQKMKQIFLIFECVFTVLTIFFFVYDFHGGFV